MVSSGTRIPNGFGLYDIRGTWSGRLTGGVVVSRRLMQTRTAILQVPSVFRGGDRATSGRMQASIRNGPPPTFGYYDIEFRLGLHP